MNGERIFADPGYLAQYDSANDELILTIPYADRVNSVSFRIIIKNLSGQTSFSRGCPYSIDDRKIYYSMKVGSGLSVPDSWKGKKFSTCRSEDIPDEISKYSVELTQISEERVVGSVEVRVEGGGPRSGDTLHAESEFDVDPSAD